MNSCQHCKKEADVPTALRDWIVISSDAGKEVVWLCSWGCVQSHGEFKRRFPRWVPTPEEEARMKE